MNNGKGLPVAPRFWARVSVASDPAACWPWTGATAQRGYGILSVNGRSRRATWISLELHGRSAPPRGQMVCHTCDNPPCVNPAHLFVGTMRDNINDARRKGRSRAPTEYLPPWQKSRTHCKRGHLWTPRRDRPGTRICEVCRKAREQKRQARRIK